MAALGMGKASNKDWGGCCKKKGMGVEEGRQDIVSIMRSDGITGGRREREREKGGAK